MMRSRKEEGGPDLCCRRRDQLPPLSRRDGRIGVRRLIRFQVLVRVFDHHDGRIYHRADRNGNAAERHQICVDALIAHHNEGSQHAQWQGKDGHQSTAQVKKKQCADQPDDDEFLDELVREIVHRPLDQLRAIIGGDHLDASGQRPLQISQFALDRLDSGQCILS